MQPIEGQKKEGALGVLKGVGQGIGGLALKPSAGKLPGTLGAYVNFSSRYFGRNWIYFRGRQ